MEKDKVITLKDLLVRIEALEGEVETLTKDYYSTATEPKPEKKAPAKPADVKELLTELAKAKKAGDTKSAFKIRRQLRKAGYSLRDVNGKK